MSDGALTSLHTLESNRSAHILVILVLYCIVLYIYIALLAVHTNQKRSQFERPRDKRASVVLAMRSVKFLDIGLGLHCVGRGGALVESMPFRGSRVRIPL